MAATCSFICSKQFETSFMFFYANNSTYIHSLFEWCTITPLSQVWCTFNYFNPTTFCMCMSKSEACYSMVIVCYCKSNLISFIILYINKTVSFLIWFVLHLWFQCLSWLCDMGFNQSWTFLKYHVFRSYLRQQSCGAQCPLVISTHIRPWIWKTYKQMKIPIQLSCDLKPYKHILFYRSKPLVAYIYFRKIRLKLLKYFSLLNLIRLKLVFNLCRYIKIKKANKYRGRRDYLLHSI